MSYVHDAVVWLNDPLNWKGQHGVVQLLVDHLRITGLSVGLASLVALPLGIGFGHLGRGGAFTVAAANVSRAVPVLAVLTILVSTPVGFGDRATVIALALFAAPVVLANAYVGMRGVDPDLVEAATAMGLSGGQVLRRVELPLALPLVAAGIRTAVVQVIATATLAALVGGGGLGTIINEGFSTQDYGETLAGGLLVSLLAVVAELGLAGLQRSLTPASLRPPRRRRRAAAVLAEAPEDPALAASGA
ncbi:osmoprotectant transport system permease protein [Motilibacter peucedani]|uniref:Osmoprotectant transport system permease protein n=1 Tax=Motilibacter peucedani TaxID=598650 RepID=A0A420XPR9_9ACTN|nr:ABC transporter permease [Motilibacter peucedani]RKS75268.1 osmoprotectant transport system permease protein [Motilibacter peucedani]